MENTAVDNRVPMSITLEDYDIQEEAVPAETLRQKLSCRRPVRCCLFCGPFIARWKCCSMCLVISYLVSIPVLFFAIHFCQYPGNMEGDFPIVNSKPSNFIANRSDGKHMQGLRCLIPWVPNSKQAPVVFFGGNGQGMSGAALDASWLFGAMYNNEKTHQFRTFHTAYRGYTPNSGWVTQAGLTNDAIDLLEHALKSSHGSPDGRVILGGWSMGAGVASQLAAARPDRIAGLVLFSPWSTLRQESLNIAAGLGHLLYPWIWLSEVWDSVAAIASLPPDIPVAIMSAEGDHVIPSWEHRMVFDASKAIKKWWLSTPGAQHQDLQAEVNEHKDKLLDWMKASWERVQVYAPANSTVVSRPFVTDTGHEAYVFLGDMMARIQSFVHPLSPRREASASKRQVLHQTESLQLV